MSDTAVQEIILEINRSLNEQITNYEVLQLYWNIGKILRKYPKLNLSWLERILKVEYGVTISFTKRNFVMMKEFYQNYSIQDIRKLKEIPWMILFKLVKNKIEPKKIIQFYYDLNPENWYQLLKEQKCFKTLKCENYLLNEICELQRKALVVD